MKKTILTIALSLILSGCVGAVPWNKQQYAGINYVQFEWCETSDSYMPCKVTIIDGKEQGAIDFSFQIDDTILNFAADDVKAFTGQELRARVEQVVAEQLGDVGPGVVDAIIAAITGGLVQ